MAGSKNRFSRESRDSIFGKIIEKEISENKNVLNFIDFIEGDSGPRVELYPVQRFLGKLLFGVPLDYKEGKIPVWDNMRENLLFTFTDREYLHYLSEEHRINVDNWQDAPGHGFNEAMLFVGRRGGKSQFVSACADFVLYKLLSTRNPQERYGLVEGSPIEFTFLAQDSGGANRLYDKFKSDINTCPFLTPFIRKTPNKKDMEFVTEADRNKRDVLPSIKIGAYSCTSNAVRGPSSIFLALDEFAHFRNEIGSSSDEVYEAAAPATMNFVNRSNNKLESLILSISSPWKRQGKAYDLFKQAMDDGPSSGILGFRCSTAEMNPHTSPEYLRKKLKSASLTWKAEYGGEFLDSSESYVPSLAIDDCWDKERENITRYKDTLAYKRYFWGLDLGTKNDATALAIGHLEFQEGRGIVLVYDYIDRMMVGEGQYMEAKELPPDDILKWLVEANMLLPCYKGATDQYGGSMLIHLLGINGIQNVDLVHLTTGINSEMYYTLKGFIDQRRVSFPNVKKFIVELKNVEAEIMGKYQIRVQAPKEKGAHDDMCDAVALVAWQANEFMIKETRYIEDLLNGIDDGSAVFMGSQEYVDPDSMSMTNLKMLERRRGIARKGIDGVPGRLTGRKF